MTRHTTPAIPSITAIPTRRLLITDVHPGVLLPGWSGLRVADTFGRDPDHTPFWYDTDGHRHYWARNGWAVIYDPGIRTDAYAATSDGLRHILLPAPATGDAPALRTLIPHTTDKALTVTVTPCPTALASLLCIPCRTRFHITATYRRSAAA